MAFCIWQKTNADKKQLFIPVSARYFIILPTNNSNELWI